MKQNETKLEAIRIRDPFILPVEEERRYYLYGTTDCDPWFGRGEGFQVWWSADLVNWEGGKYAFCPPPGFWATENFWAPEVHRYHGQFYMLASFHAKGRCRGVQILRSGRPEGPFTPVSNGPVTPPAWECLDGTLFIEDDVPYLVFCHEWTQIHNGTVCCARLSGDLKELASEPVVLFHAKNAPWSIPYTGEVIRMPGENYVTDGPFLFRTDGGELRMLWSSYCSAGYAIGVAYSESGRLQGPWYQYGKPFFEKDGGHGMLFTTFNGEKKLVMHTPNTSPLERAVLLDVAFHAETGLIRME